MHNEKLVIALKSHGKILREFKDTCYIPFGQEYSILIKNLNSVRVQLRIQVDGQDATEGCSLVVNPNSSLELQRFIKNGNMHEGNRFKFIERTAGIEQHRGVQIEDGLIRVEFQFEKVLPKPITIPVIHEHHDYYYHHPYWTRPKPYYPPYNPWRDGEVWCDTKVQSTFTSTSASTEREQYTSGVEGNNSVFVNQVQCGSGLSQNSGEMARGITCSAGGKSEAQQLADHYRAKQDAAMAEEHVMERKGLLRDLPKNETGITVPGSKSRQQFNWVPDFSVEDEVHVIVLKILGETETGHVVKEAVIVKRQVRCTTCGKHNKATAKFCSECATSLEIV